MQVRAAPGWRPHCTRPLTVCTLGAGLSQGLSPLLEELDIVLLYGGATPGSTSLRFGKELCDSFPGIPVYGAYKEKKFLERRRQQQHICRGLLWSALILQLYAALGRSGGMCC